MGPRDRGQMGADPLSRAAGRRGACDRQGHRPTAGSRLPLAAVVVVATVLYGGAWPLAIVPLVGNAALETSYAIPHRLEQLGLPTAVAIGLAVAAFVAGYAWLVREAGRGRARLGLAACLVLVDDALPRGLVPGLGGASRRGGRGCAGNGSLPRPLPLPPAPDDSV